MKKPHVLRFCIASFLMLTACREEGFLPLAEAQAFSKSAQISPQEADALLSAYLQRIGRRPRMGRYAYRRCYIRNGEYYFLNDMVKRGPYDGFVVNATTGELRRVTDVDCHLLPRYSYEEQNTALFPVAK